MPQRVQTLRSSTKNTRPPAGSQEPGTLYTNWPDKQIGVIDAGKVAMDLVAVRFFSATTNYATGDYVHNAGHVYRANKAIVAGAFNPTDWDTAPTTGEFEPPIAAGTTADYWRGDKSWQTLNKSAVGLGAVDNTSDASKPVSTATQTALNLKADLASPTFTGDPKAPTASPGDNDTSIATTAFTTAAIAVSDAAQATALGLKANLASPTFTGDPKAPTPAPGDNDTSIATTAYTTAAITAATSTLLTDAPSDGFVYGRKNATWATVIGGAHTDDSPPAGPLQDGQLWYRSSDGAMFIWYVDADSSAWVQVNAAPVTTATAEARNRIINGNMCISQENANTAGTTTGYYAADQWGMWKNHSAGTMTARRVQSITPNGSKDRFRITVTTQDATLAAGEYLYFSSSIEGNRTADFRWGTASAKQCILRFGWKSPAGTYSIGVGNGTTRSYVANFTIAAGQANTDTEQVFVIPGDTTGAWPTDTGSGLNIWVCIATGSTYLGVAGWQAGIKLNLAGVTNGMTPTGAIYELYDVGLYYDPNATGVAPPWQMPDEAQELALCQRYFYNGTPPLRGVGSVANTASRMGCWHPVTMRTTPALAVTAGLPVFEGTTPLTIVGVNAAYSNATVLEFEGGTAGTYAAGLALVAYQNGGGNINVSARM